MATQFRQIGGQLGGHLGVKGYPTGIEFIANPVGCIDPIKALLRLRVKQFGGQPVDEKAVFNVTSFGGVGVLRGGAATGGGLWRDTLDGEVPRFVGVEANDFS